MIRESDPEVLADLRLRDRTARERADRRGVAGLDVGHDPDGLSPELARLYDGVPDRDVESWPCRGGCGRMVGVPQVAIDRLAAFNRMLANARQKPVGRHEVMWCPGCKRENDALEQARRRPHEQRQIPLDNERPTTAGKGRS